MNLVAGAAENSQSSDGEESREGGPHTDVNAPFAQSKQTQEIPAVNEDHEGDAAVCWICHDTFDAENPSILNVCRCRGTSGHVHQDCINDWVFQSQRSSCISCGARYLVKDSIKDGAPPEPKSLYDTSFFILRFYLTRCIVPAIKIGVWSSIRNCLIPMCYGMYFFLFFYTKEELEGGFCWKCFFGGLTASIAYRYTLREWNRWMLFFGRRSPADEDESSGNSHFWVGKFMCRIKSLEVVTGVDQPLQSAKEILGEACFVIVLGLCVAYALWVPFLLLFALAVGIRLNYAHRVLQNKTRRYEEAQENKENFTEAEQNIYYITHMTDVLLFMLVVPTLVAFSFHYAVTPEFLRFQTPIFETTFISLMVHWGAGVFLLMLILLFESNFIVAIFASGVDLFFMRSMDVAALEDMGDESEYNLIFSMIYDTDPLRIFLDAMRVCLVESLGFFLLARIPILALTFFSEQWEELSAAVFEVAPDELISANVFRLPFSTFFPISSWSASAINTTVVPVVGGEENATATAMVPPYCGVDLSCANYLRLACSLFFITAFAVQMFIQPLHRPVLRVLLPVAKVLGKLLGLEAYLFDTDRLQMVNDWLRTGRADEGLTMPRVSATRMMIRRDRWFEPHQLPSYLRLRMILFSALFWSCALSLLSLMFVSVALPVAVLYARSGIELIAVTLAIIGLLASPKYCGQAAFYVLCGALLVPIFGVMILSETIGPYLLGAPTCWSDLVMQVYKYEYSSGRNVVPRGDISNVEEEEDRARREAAAAEDSEPSDESESDD